MTQVFNFWGSHPTAKPLWRTYGIARCTLARIYAGTGTDGASELGNTMNPNVPPIWAVLRATEIV